MQLATTVAAGKIGQEELERANNIINQFITSCSHSMRGPLKSIEGLVNLLRHDHAEEKDSETFLRLIEQSAFKMEHMLDELEQFMENMKREVVAKPVNFSQLVVFVLKKYRNELSAFDIEVHEDIRQLAPFYSDQTRMQLILAHLVANAIQFRDERKTGKWIGITVFTDADGCTIRVTDNGIGIEPESHERIFDLFYRASEKSQGHGVGLYVVKEVVEKMNGKISVEATLDKGSIFTVRLPNRVE